MKRGLRELVHVTVKGHLHHGLFIELDNGQKGIVRAREVSWDEEIVADWKKNFPVGWRGNALFTPAQQGHEHEYSLRLAESDPWDDILEKYEEGQIFEGTVTSVVDFGAFVEIAPGITGLLREAEFPLWRRMPARELFWPGDKVLVTLHKINLDLREINLGLPPLQQIAEEPLGESKYSNPTDDSASSLDKLVKNELPVKHILIVEDEDGQSQAVAGWLRNFAQRVDVVKDAKKAIEFFQTTEPDVALIDIGLPGMSGTDLAKFTLTNYPEVQVVITTDWAHANDAAVDIEETRLLGAKLLLKPLLPEDLVNLLLHINEIENRELAEESTSGNVLTLSDVPSLDSNKSIQELLIRCKKNLGFDLAVLFSLDPVHRSINVVDSSGSMLTNSSAIPSLIYSPVRDVAEDKKVIIQPEINDRDVKRFRYLRELYPTIASCIGVPIPSSVSNDFALFIIDDSVRKINNEQKVYVEGIAIAIGAFVDRNHLREKSILLQRTALIGHLTRAMMHEINNLVGPLLYEAETLKKSLKHIEKNPLGANYEEINNEISRIQFDVRKLISTTKTFGRIVAKGGEEVIRIDEIVEETLGLLKDIGDRAHVELKFYAPEKMIVSRGRSVVLEQVFLNVALNAIQQIAEVRPDHGGWVKITMNIREKNLKEADCQIGIEDNGPGIHFSLWKKIFEPGFTTRRDGSGIGLYVSKNLIESVDGRIYVENSHMLSGTLFILQIPVRL